MKTTDLPADPASLYEAYASRDRRFDGVFFIAVATTRIYCRPICPARTARRANCTFFVHAAQAESAGYRPCRRCRPERAPGKSTIDTTARLLCEVTERLTNSRTAATGNSVHVVAKDLHVSPRHLRRVVRRELGVSPMEVLLTRRLLVARRLLAETDLRISSIAEASGFSSVRRFNDAILKRYGTPPGELRRQLQGLAGGDAADDTLTIELPYRPPFDWEGTLGFLAARALRGVEAVDDTAYLRTARLRGRTGWIRVTHADASSALRLEVAAPLTGVLSDIIRRVRRLFDLGADCRAITHHLGSDPLLAASVERYPGLRVPGAFDGFELALRAILGQQVTVRAAATLAARIVEGVGEKVDTPFDGLDRLSPRPEMIARADPESLVTMGILRSRALTLIGLAQAVEAEAVRLEPGHSLQESLERLQCIRGIGPWTAQYIAMRALCWPDAFPHGDVALRRMLGAATPARAEAISQAWRPWRSYATMHLWRMSHP